MTPKCLSLIHARRSRNGKDASDLVAVLLSSVGALHDQAAVLSGDVRRLSRKIREYAPRRRLPSSENSKRMRAHSDSSVGGPATSSQTQWAVIAHKPVNLLSNPIDGIFQAEIITFSGGAWSKPKSSTQIRISS